MMTVPNFRQSEFREKVTQAIWEMLTHMPETERNIFVWTQNTKEVHLILTVDIYCRGISIQASDSSNLPLARLFFLHFAAFSGVSCNICFVREKPMSLVCSKCKKSLTVKESVLATHQCGQLTSKAAPRMLIRKTGDYVKNHFTELIAAEMRKTVV